MTHSIKRGMSAMLALLLVISLFSGLVVPAQAATVKNYGYRGNTATMFSSYATKFYSKNDVTYEDLAALSGASDVNSVPGSALYNKLQQLMRDNHTHITDYKETIEYYPYTDCQGEGDVISSFYSGKEIGPAWDSGATWNREHTWPNSKGLNGDDENDIMMLRPTASNENSSRSNKAYGISSGYYNPNSESGGLYNLHGDVARIVLYVYVRWGNTSHMWGSEGVIESKDVLLDWIEEDPVDTWELGRNDAVMSITGTRNVFVDYPELAFLLFNEEIPAGMTTPSGNTGVSYDITATVNDASMGSVSVAGSNIKATPAEGHKVTGYEVISGSATVTQNGNVFSVSAKSDCTIQINFAPIVVPETLEEQLAEASKLANKEYLPYTTTIEGKVSEINEAYSTQYKNICFHVDVNGIDVYCYRVKGTGMDTLAVGDTVKVVGNLTAYEGTAQFDSTATVTVLDKVVVPGNPELDTPEKIVNAAYELAEGASLPGTYTLEGVITSIDTKYSEQYNNITVTIVVGDMTDKPIQCFRMKGDGIADLARGDTITVTGTLKNHYNTIEFDAGCTMDAVVKGETPENTVSTIDFSTKDQRVSFGATQTVWSNDGITLTNNKASSTTNNADYANPTRIYAKSQVIIEYPGMTKIVFTCGGGKNLTAASFSGVDAKVTISGNVATVEFDEPVDSLTFTAAAQFRLSLLEVYAASTEEEGCKHENLVHVEESCYNVEHWYCEACQVWWQDEALTQITNSKNVIKAEPSHALEHMEESCYNVEHWYCEACQTWWQDEALTQITNSKNVIKAEPTHELEHLEESCYHVEHWYCNVCETFWADEALTQVTNSKNVIKAKPSHVLEHVEESCYNTEYWTCSECETYWADEALTQITNRLNVIKAVPSHELTHVKAKASTCVEEGNIEHWYCDLCEQVWQDKALTQITNHKNVITPVDEDAHDWSSWTEIDKKCQEKRTCKNDGCDEYEVRDIDHIDKNPKDEECDVCGADLSNSKTADTILIFVLFMAAAGVLILLFLTAAPTAKGKYLK